MKASGFEILRQEMLQGCPVRSCPLHVSRLAYRSIKGLSCSGFGPIPGEGSANAQICFIGRNPGVKEVERLRPFVGPAGRRYDRVLEGLKLERLKCVTDNLVKCFTLENKPPPNLAVAKCTKKWLIPSLLSLPRLKLVVLLGRQA